ncbi:hypothetical protein NW768_002537 [Fusarium equiseti]|uniref:Uncharacterized protein n=1 Tax=Fusarium equiseti TaxID=61235 RepID=A0ABQ8RNR3_FUSEQ|nr:hypothetical protein NW768_002537 [Fusarium equiseti]
MAKKSHCYCAICGGPTGRLKWGAGNRKAYRRMITERLVDWLVDVELLCEKTCPKKILLVPGFEHQNERNFRYISLSQPAIHRRKIFVEAYAKEGLNGNRKPVFVFHTACRKVLQQAFGPNELDLQLLYTTLERHYPWKSPTPNKLDYDYGVVQTRIDGEEFMFQVSELQNYQDWKIKRGSESVVLSPNVVYDNDIDKILQKAVDLTTAPVLKRLKLGDSFLSWKDKFHHDLPWAVAFITPDLQRQPPRSSFWGSVYVIFKSVDNDNGMGMVNCLALQNRARVWELCTKIIVEYNVLRDEQLNDPIPALEASYLAKDEIEKYTPHPTWCQPKPTTKYMSPKNIAFLGLTPYSEPRLTMNWITEHNGPALVGFMVQSSEACGGAMMGNIESVASTDVWEDPVSIPRGSWIHEIDVYSEDHDADTCYRHCEAKTTRQPIRIIRGLQLFLTDGRMVKMGACDIVRRDITAHRAPPGHFISSVEAVFARRKLVRKLQFHYHRISEAHPDCRARLTPLDEPELDTATSSEKLNLASSINGLRKIISFGVDVHLGGFELTFWENDQRKTIAIGPHRTAMKYLTFEGLANRDDYIIGCWVHKYIDRPVGLRFVTRKGRQLIAGQPGTYEKPLLLSNELGRGVSVKTIISELSAEWCCVDTPQPKMTAFNVVHAGLPGNFLVENTVPFDCTVAELPGDSKDVCFDSNYPAMYIPKLDGLITHKLVSLPKFGREKSTSLSKKHTVTQRNGRLYSWKTTVSYLDLSGRIEGIKTTTVHQFSNQLPIVAMQVRRHPDDNKDHDREKQTGSTETSFGPTSFDTDFQCICSYFPKLFRKQSPATSHYSQSEWDAGRQEIKSLRMWNDAKKDLVALQFVATDGTESPKWGCYQGKGALFVEVERLPGSAGAEAGILVYLDSNLSPSLHDDFVMVGIRTVGFGEPVVSEWQAREERPADRQNEHKYGFVKREV